MSIRSILAPLDGASDNQAILDTALNLACAFNAHLEVLHVRPDPRDAMPLFGEGMSGDLVEDIIATADREAGGRADRLRAMFAERAETRSIPQVAGPGGGEDAATVAWREDMGREDEMVAWRGRLSDLIVTARPGEGSSPMRGLTLHAALFDSGRPVLALPIEPEVHEIGRSIAIAWNGTAQSARAVRGAMPLILRAAEVHVLTCESERSNPTPADELAAYLGWWGVTPHTHCFPPEEEGAGYALLGESRRVMADMLVCGAYSHPRLMQTVLGGVTSVLMDEAGIPVLFSH
ncbi:MAG: universal stress protein [Alphaproteobacteria bacterium]|nr:universal stress protein [Alphaproteobacteria bacterium]MBF0251232.1 universal stress protein [Alphaproteobacteria bacterium]